MSYSRNRQGLLTTLFSEQGCSSNSLYLQFALLLNQNLAVRDLFIEVLTKILLSDRYKLVFGYRYRHVNRNRCIFFVTQFFFDPQTYIHKKTAFFSLTETRGLKRRHVTGEAVGSHVSVEIEQLFKYLFFRVLHFQRGQCRGFDVFVGQHVVVRVTFFSIPAREGKKNEIGKKNFPRVNVIDLPRVQHAYRDHDVYE